jgi:hypothetical protein
VFQFLPGIGKAHRKSLRSERYRVAGVEVAAFASEASSTIGATCLRQTRPMNGISVMARQINMTFCLLMAFLYRARGQATVAISTVFFFLSLT